MAAVVPADASGRGVVTSCPDCGPRPAGAYEHARWCGTLARQDWRERNPWVVLVTGSRDGVPAGLVERRVEEEVRAAVLVGYLAVVRHGAARGADRRAGALTRAMGLTGWRVVEDPYPVSDAEWRASRAAGFMRNQRMVDAEPRPNVCLAFAAPGGSGGTADCAARARRAGVEVA